MVDTWTFWLWRQCPWDLGHCNLTAMALLSNKNSMSGEPSLITKTSMMSRKHCVMTSCWRQPCFSPQSCLCMRSQFEISLRPGYCHLCPSHGLWMQSSFHEVILVLKIDCLFSLPSAELAFDYCSRTATWASIALDFCNIPLRLTGFCHSWLARLSQCSQMKMVLQIKAF